MIKGTNYYDSSLLINRYAVRNNPTNLNWDEIRCSILPFYLDVFGPLDQ